MVHANDSASPTAAGAGALPTRHPRSCSLDNFDCLFLDAKGRPVPLYRIARDGNQINCFVEAEEGQEFALFVTAKGPERRTWAADILLGGHFVSGWLLRPGQCRKLMTGRRVGVDKEQALTFSKALVTDDDTNSIRDPAEASKLCEVAVKLMQVAADRPSTSASFMHDENSALVPSKAVYEKVKKVGAVGFAGGRVKTTAFTDDVTCDFAPDALQLVFNFRCVTRLGLQLMRILPMEDEEDARKERAAAERRKAELQAAAKRRREEEAELEQATERLRKRLRELEKRKQVLQDSSQHNHVEPAAARAPVAARVKNEKVEFDFSQGGRMENPLLIQSDDEA